MKEVLQKRDFAFDIAKGLAILLMLIGHTDIENAFFNKVINSFHMPLFFILAGYFTHIKEGELVNDIKKCFKRLLLPYFVTFLILILWGGVQSIFKNQISWFLRPILSMLYGSRDVVGSKFGAISAGPMWFLLGLFWSKCLFVTMLHKCNKILVVIISIFLSLLAVFLYNKTHFAYASIFPGLSGLAFMAIGWWYKNYKVNKWIIRFAIICWFASLLVSNGIIMAVCSYDIYVLDVVGACGATYLVVLLSEFLSIKVKWLVKPFVWCGQNSLGILCFHTFEVLSAIAYSIVIHLPWGYLSLNWMTVFRYSLTLLIVFAISKTPKLKNIYS